MPIGELALNAWILKVRERLETKVSQIENSCTQCRVSLADPNTRGVYYVCPTVLSVFYDKIAITDNICS